MPELPDVEVYRRHLAATSLHRRISTVERLSTEMVDGVSATGLRRSLRGSAFEGTRRHGKWLFARCDERWLALHFGMTGHLQYLDDPEPAPSHTRMLVCFSDGHALAYDSQRKLGRIGLTDDIEVFVKERDLGPDALALGAEAFRDLVHQRRRGALKALVTDQAALAGVGNVYSDEILFRARLHPRLPVRDLDDRATGRLHGAVQRVLRTAIERRADPGRMPRTWLLPTREAGAPCPRCSTPIERATVAGRSSYFCPRCQPRG